METAAAIFTEHNDTLKPNTFDGKTLAAARIRIRPSVVELEEVDGRRLVDFDAVARGNEPQRVIDVRQMIDGHIANKSAIDVGAAHAAMQPAEKDTELRQQGEGDDQPVGVHAGVKQCFGLRMIRGWT
jgi:hypothetical protein